MSVAMLDQALNQITQFKPAYLPWLKLCNKLNRSNARNNFGSNSEPNYSVQLSVTFRGQTLNRTTYTVQMSVASESNSSVQMSVAVFAQTQETTTKLQNTTTY